MTNEIENNWMGKVPFNEGLILQEKALEKVKVTSQVVVLGLEHPEVITLGLRSHKDPQLLALENQHQIVKIRRGGHATAHNPGQLVIYPVLPLREMGLGVKDFVCVLTRTTKDFFRHFGVEAREKEEPGLFTDKGKIALFGIQVNQGISQHGLSININNDLEIFKKIAVCNVNSQPMDRLDQYSENTDLESLFELWMQFFGPQLQGMLENTASCNS
ncbi:MAG: lipoyl(octanoyl) transferase LipB [Bdellovibrionales bacterium]|nr:lipoyl(octanoyl) transferase LipB [Bdellovibrionales bacterium]NQZ19839.1 lipoyl(octanoyl) transferase LipB [Bdellovibrionales bacterium]